MPRAGTDRKARAQAHFRWAQRHTHTGSIDQAVAHFGRALEYSSSSLDRRPGFGVSLVPERLIRSRDERGDIIINPPYLPYQVTMALDIKTQGDVSVFAFYRAHDVRCNINLHLIDATLSLERLTDIDPVALDSRTSDPEKYRHETKALFEEIKGSDESRSVCLTTINKNDGKGNKHETSRGLLMSVLRAVFEFLVECGSLSTSSRVFLAPSSATDTRKLVTYYEENSFRSVDGVPSIMKTTISEFLVARKQAP